MSSCSNYKNNMLPVSFKKFFFSFFFTVNGENHNHNTRNRYDFEIQIHKVETISTMGPKIWNRLPNNVFAVLEFHNSVLKYCCMYKSL